MAEIDITDKDRVLAEDFLVEVLEELIPDADFSPGSITRDHTVTAISAVYALLRKEATLIRDASSLERVGNIENDREYTQAVENILSNWFLSRKPGTSVTGTITLHFANKENGRLPASTSFVKEPGIVFRPTSGSDLFYRESDLDPVVNSAGEITSYTLRVNVQSQGVGAQYEIRPGRFAFVDPFSAEFLYAENQAQFTGASNPESAAELIERAPDAITKRDLSSTKSIAAVLREEFTEISNVVVHGFGDDGMRRDLLNDPTAYYQIHLGGHVDAYVSTPAAEDRVFETDVGGIFTDQREGVTLFKDSNIDDWRTSVDPGDVIFIYSALSTEPERYLIEEVTKYFLRVHDRQPFPEERPTAAREENTITGARVSGPDQVRSVTAQFTSQDVGRYIRITNSTEGNDGDYLIESVDTANDTVTLDTDTLVNETTADLTISIFNGIVDYSIGDQPPNYDNKIARRSTGTFSRAYQEDGVIKLPQEPIYRIKEVSLIGTGSPLADPVTGKLLFPERVNKAPEPTEGADLQYQVIGKDPHRTPSPEQMMLLRLRFSPEESEEDGYLFFDNASPAFTSSAYGFNDSGVDSDIGKRVRIIDAYYPENRGEYVIDDVDSGTAYLVTPDGSSWNPTPEKRLKWELIEPTKYNGETIRVVYDTATQFNAISTFVNDRSNRIPAGNLLARAFHPVYLSFEIKYKVRNNVLSTVSNADAKSFLAGYINAFPEDDTIHISDIVTAFNQRFIDTVGSVQLPMSVTYSLYAPDGRRIDYQTDDAIEISKSKLLSSDPIKRLENPLELGVTEDNVRYFSDESLITITQV